MVMKNNSLNLLSAKTNGDVMNNVARRTLKRLSITHSVRKWRSYEYGIVHLLCGNIATSRMEICNTIK